MKPARGTSRARGREGREQRQPEQAATARAAPARAAALRVYDTVAHGSGTLPDALAAVQATLADPRDRALTAEIVSGTFRWLAAIDHALAGLASRPLDRIDPIVLGILRLSAYQLLYLDRVPARAVVFDAVARVREAGKTSASGFVNAVLRKLTQADRATLWPSRAGFGTGTANSADALAYLSVTLSHPRWLVERWRDRHGFEATEAWGRFDNAPAPLTLRANTLQITRDALQARLAELGIVTEATRFAPDGLIVREGHPLQSPLARSGLFTTQDEASQLVACIAQAAIPKRAQRDDTSGRDGASVRGETTYQRARTESGFKEFASEADRVRVRVLDACAAPGGKTIALAAAISGDDIVIATDRRRRRLRLLVDTVGAARATQVRIAQVDLQVGLPFGPVFDLVLVDAPCSGLGTLRREPEIRWRRSADELPRLAARQQQMLEHAAASVRPGGRLVYATCSSEPEENEEVAAAFLAAHPAFRPVAAQAMGFPPSIAPVLNDAGHLRTWPFAHGLEAFFAAVFERDAAG